MKADQDEPQQVARERASTNRAGRPLGRCLAFCAALSAFSAVSTEAQTTETSPSVLLGLHLTLSFWNGGAPEVACILNLVGDTAPVFQNRDGSFTCGPDISGRLVDVLDRVGSVAGRRVYITRRVSATVSEQYAGALDWDPRVPLQFIAGEYARTTTTKTCLPVPKPCLAAAPCRQQCLTTQLVSGPFPFSGSASFDESVQQELAQ